MYIKDIDIIFQYTATPEEIIREAIYFRIKSSVKYKTPEEKQRAVLEHSSAYVLKVAGSDQMYVQPKKNLSNQDIMNYDDGNLVYILLFT